MHFKDLVPEPLPVHIVHQVLELWGVGPGFQVNKGVLNVLGWQEWKSKKLSDVCMHSLLFPVSSHQSTTLHMSPHSLGPMKDAAFDGDSRKHPTNGIPGTWKKRSKY